MNDDKLHQLIAKYLADECTPAEKLEVERWYDGYNAGNDQFLDDEDGKIRERALHSFDQLSERLGLVPEQQHGNIRPLRLRRKLWLAAASALLVCSIGGYFLLRQNHTRQNDLPVASLAIHPGSEKAILTLPGGKTINLTDAKSGELAKAGGIRISKTADGQIVYNSAGAAQGSNIKAEYNTLSTPRGGQFQVILPDGTHVWLNAASSIIYPTAFSGNTRAVTLQGEAYFEVAKNKEKPFIVTANQVDVRVLGTHFNVNAYQDDAAVTTTLLEGSVQLNKGSQKTMLSPGLQGVAVNNQSGIAVQQADIEQVMAWRNGNFAFEDLSIRDVMKIAARWYDVEVQFRNDIENKKFGGTISRYKDITELLDNISQSGGFHYQIEGRRIILTK